MRDLVHALVAADADDETLDAVTHHVREALTLLGSQPRRVREIPDLTTIMANAANRGQHAMADRAIGGYANPISVELDYRREDDVAVATVVYRPAFEGALGRVHGGIVAATFDDLMGFVLAIVKEPAFTGRLIVNYKSPVPMDTLVEFRAWMREREGRKLFVDAECRLDDTVLATAEILFVIVDPAHFATHANKLLGNDGAQPGT